MADKPQKSDAMVEDESYFSADGLRTYMGKRAAAETLDDARREEAEQAAKKAMIDDLMKPVEVTQERRDRFMRRLKEAADSGKSELLVLARHDLEDRALARAVEAEHADLRPGEEAQPDVLEDLLAARPDLGQALHRVDVLVRSHGMRSPGD